MNKTFVVYLKAFIAFVIPLLTGFGSAATLYEVSGLPAHWKIVLIATTCLSLVAAFSGLNAFMSRSYADHMDAQDISAGVPQIATVTVTQVAEPPAPISSPANPKPV